MSHLDPDLLLELARQALIEQVLGKPAEQARYPTLMAANAISLVRRHHELAPEAAELWQAVIADLAGIKGGNARAEFAAAIRAGRLDDCVSELFPALKQLLEAELAITNPSFLERG
jgi:AAA+ superfamily predicted ATPase